MTCLHRFFFILPDSLYCFYVWHPCIYGAAHMQCSTSSPGGIWGLHCPFFILSVGSTWNYLNFTKMTQFLYLCIPYSAYMPTATSLNATVQDVGCCLCHKKHTAVDVLVGFAWLSTTRTPVNSTLACCLVYSLSCKGYAPSWLSKNIKKYEQVGGNSVYLGVVFICFS